MLTFAFCLIAFFVGACLTIWFIFSFIGNVFSKIGNMINGLIDHAKTEFSESTREDIAEKIVKIDLRSMAEMLSFAVNFAVEKMAEFEVLNKQREADLKRRQDDQDAARQAEIEKIQWMK